MKTLQRLLAIPLAALMITVPLAGCQKATPSQVIVAVTDIQQWAPVITADVSALAGDIASFGPADAVAINKFVTTLQADSPRLQALCQAYLSAPSTAALQQLAALITDMATADSSALLGLAAIKNPQSQLIAKGVLTTLATAFTIVTAFAAQWQTSSALKVTNGVTVAQLRPSLSRPMLEKGLAQAKAGGLAPRWLTVDQALDQAETRGF